MWFEWMLVHACTLPLWFFFGFVFYFTSILLWGIAPRNSVFLHWVSQAETCKTWQRMVSAAMRDSTEHDSPLPTLSICFAKNEKRERKEEIPPPAWNEMDGFQRFISCQISVKLSLQSYGCIIESRSNCVCYTLKMILYTIYFPDISICRHSSATTLLWKSLLLVEVFVH